MYLRLFTAALALLLANSVQAEIYTCTNAKGETIYTDSPSQCANAEEVNVDTLPTLVPTKPISVPANNQTTNNSKKTENDKGAYSELVITSPANDAVLRDNQGNLTINFRSTPALETRRGHKYVIALDGKDVYSGTSTITALQNVDRGTHTITAKIIDSSGKVIITSASVSATLQRYSALQNNTLGSGDGGTDVPDGGNTNSQAFPSNTRFPRQPSPASN